jgi:hypothetical protein
MVINNEYKFIFIHVPKAAGTSLTRVLQALKGNSFKLLARTKHETLGEFISNWKNRCDPSTVENPETFFRFAFVRNPWVRMHSFYTYLKEMRPRHEIDSVKSFKDFLQQSCDPESWINTLHSMRPQLDYFATSSGMLEMDFVGHYEFLQEDLSRISSEIGINIQIPHLNKSSGSDTDYRKSFDKDMVEIVYSRFKDDIEKFGYCFEKAPPSTRYSGRLNGSR